MIVQAALFAVGLLVLAGLSLAAHNLPYLPGDVAITHAVQAPSSDWLDSATNALSWTGFPPQSNIILGVVVALMVAFRARLAAACELVAAIGTVVMYFQLERLVGQPRPSPDLVRVTDAIQMTGFPSGHVATFVAVFGFAAFVVYRRMRGSPRRWAPVAVFGVLLVCLSFARIYSGHHWASAVLGGAVLGALWVAVAARLLMWAEDRFAPAGSALRSARRATGT